MPDSKSLDVKKSILSSKLIKNPIGNVAKNTQELIEQLILIANRNIPNEPIATSTESLLIDVHHTNYGNITRRMHIIKIIIISKGHHQRCPQRFAYLRHVVGVVKHTKHSNEMCVN